MQSQRDLPMHIESQDDAIREAVNAIGGKKVVGIGLKPDRDPTDAGKWVADCLNPHRAERFNPEQLAWVRRHARMAGCHTLASYEMREAGYARPVPVAPEDEAAQLQREFVAAVARLEKLQARMIAGPTLRAVGS